MEMSEEELAAVIAAWYWCPPGSIVFESNRFRLTLWKLSTESNIVDRFNDRDTDVLIADVEKLVKSNERNVVTWQCKPGSLPADMGQVLIGHGYVPDDRLDYLYFDMGEGRWPVLPRMRIADGVEVKRIRTVQDAMESLKVSEWAFQRTASSDEETKERAENIVKESEEEKSISMTVSCNGKTVASGGATLDGNILKLWGGGTHPDCRNRGMYGALVQARCSEGFRLGARYAVVTARESTSMPILLKAGFRRVGSELHFRRKLLGA